MYRRSELPQIPSEIPHDVETAILLIRDFLKSKLKEDEHDAVGVLVCELIDRTAIWIQDATLQSVGITSPKEGYSTDNSIN